MKNILKCLFSSACLILFASCAVLSQRTGNHWTPVTTSTRVSNLRVEQDPELRYYKITFDLSGNANDAYLVQVVPYKNGRELSNLSYLSGDGIKGSVSPRKNLCIFWDAILEGYESEGWKFQLTTNPLPKGMIYVEGGTFMMGSNDGRENEKPIHEVTLSSFWIGKYEVTQKEWVEVMGSNPSRWSGDQLPVENVSWYDAVEYCNKRSIREGLTPCYSGSGEKITCNWSANGYRLPTEAEWEFAARGGLKSKGYKFSGSDDLNAVAWYTGNSGQRTQEVGTKNPNELGIFDISGNVWEHCWDWYDSSYYGKSPNSDPKGAGSGPYRVLRGGSWNNNENYCRTSNRGSYPDSRYGSNGFRVSRALL